MAVAMIAPPSGIRRGRGRPRHYKPGNGPVPAIRDLTGDRLPVPWRTVASANGPTLVGTTGDGAFQEETPAQQKIIDP